jgi:ATP-dependent RNA circularization protein (DNA/RNA ligase family)
MNNFFPKGMNKRKLQSVLFVRYEKNEILKAFVFQNVQVFCQLDVSRENFTITERFENNNKEEIQIKSTEMELKKERYQCQEHEELLCMSNYNLQTDKFFFQLKSSHERIFLQANPLLLDRVTTSLSLLKQK